MSVTGSRVRWKLSIACIALALAPLVPARADDKPLNGPCHLGHRHVLPPGCIPSTLDKVDDAVPSPLTLPNLRPRPLFYVEMARDSEPIDPVGIVHGPGDGPLLLRFTTVAAN